MRNLFGILTENLSNSVGSVRVRSNKPTHTCFSRGFKGSSAAQRFPGSLLLDGDFRAAQKETGVKDADIADGSDVDALNIKREEKGKVCRLLNSKYVSLQITQLGLSSGMYSLHTSQVVH